jgi:hypothetical protein
MEQINVRIGKVELPAILDEGREWYPLNAIAQKVLGKPKGMMSGKGVRERYSRFMKKHVIEFGEKNVQESNCMSKEGLVEFIGNSHIGRLDSESRKKQNILRKHLGLDLIDTLEQDVPVESDYEFIGYSDYELEVIHNELANEEVNCLRKCNKCERRFPMTSRFFALDSRASKGFAMICKVCTGKVTFFEHQNKTIHKFKKLDEDLVESYRNESVVDIYKAVLDGKLKKLPDCFENEESYMQIIKWLYRENMINENNLTLGNLSGKYKLKRIHLPQMRIVYELLFGKDFIYYIWKYPKYRSDNNELDYELGNRILQNYLNENDIIIDDVLAYSSYEQLLRDSRLSKFNNNILEFIVQFNNYKYAGFQYKLKSVNYYKNEKNLLFDLRYFIERVQKLQIEKIPLYLTKMNLQRNCLPLYHYIVNNKNGSIFEWVDKLYPNKFIELDFDINAYREEFDSDTECFIHELLKEEFNNVIYNFRNSERSIEVGGKVPDWLIFSDQGVWIVEYFGMVSDRQTENSRIIDYRKKMEDKLNVYKTLDGYRFVLLYPEDIENEFAGCREIIAKMKENPYFTML